MNINRNCLRLEMVLIQGTHGALGFVEASGDDAHSFELIELLGRGRLRVLDASLACDGVGIGRLVARELLPLGAAVHVRGGADDFGLWRLGGLLGEEKGLLRDDGLLLRGLLGDGDLLARGETVGGHLLLVRLGPPLALGARHRLLLVLTLDQLGLLLEHRRLLCFLRFLQPQALQELLFLTLESRLRLNRGLLDSRDSVLFVIGLSELHGLAEPSAHVSELEVSPCLRIRVLLPLIVVVVDALVVNKLPAFILVALPCIFLLAITVAVRLVA